MDRLTVLEIMAEDDLGLLGDDYVCFKRDDLFVVVAWEEDNDGIADSFDFGDEEVNQQYLAKFEEGEYVSLYLKAAYFDANGDCVKHDGLGQCHVSMSNLRKDIETLAKASF